MRLRRSVVPLIPVLLLAGCSGKYAPVSGKVTLDGRPVAGVRISFVPVSDSPKESAPSSAGITDAEGHYTLQVINPPGGGAYVGKHRVYLSKKDDGQPGSPPPEQLPGRYNAESEIVIQVPAGGTSTADFELQSK